jgi:hypothetical protein
VTALMVLRVLLWVACAVLRIACVLIAMSPDPAWTARCARAIPRILACTITFSGLMTIARLLGSRRWRPHHDDEPCYRPTAAGRWLELRATLVVVLNHYLPTPTLIPVAAFTAYSFGWYFSDEGKS